ncbi:MAG TPA: hypothetical protein VLG37_03865 [Candidatus Saccharimonadales bacterium]|nr:hypothetical protein [Candidatus Saccharimonadales bacterium]
MPFSEQADELLEQKPKNKYTEPEEPKPTLKQQQKQDALDLAEIIYDIYKDSLSSANIVSETRKDYKYV